MQKRDKTVSIILAFWVSKANLSPKGVFLVYIFLYILRICFVKTDFLTSIHRCQWKIKRNSFYCPDVLGKRTKFDPKLALWYIFWYLLCTRKLFFCMCLLFSKYSQMATQYSQYKSCSFILKVYFLYKFGP